MAACVFNVATPLAAAPFSNAAKPSLEIEQLHQFQPAPARSECITCMRICDGHQFLGAFVSNEKSREVSGVGKVVVEIFNAREESQP